MVASSSAATAAQSSASAEGVTWPDAPRIVYDRNPLTQVICQLRFPPVLRIEAELPAGFQERIRGLLPMYRESDSQIALPAGVPLPEEIANLVRANTKKPRTFASADDRWVLTLTKDFLALSTNQYVRWEEFRRYLDSSLTALEAEYSPALYSRIGLRYQNLVRRSTLKLADVDWSDLLRHQLAGELSAKEIAPFVESTARQTVVRLSRFESRVAIRHGLVLDGDEHCYAIDNDFYTKAQTENANVVPILQFFSAQAHCLFRWCIADRLHDAMGPNPLP
jgi:uncharacterized protein (TIGR04255 family)